jgi:hypothetical protein
MALTGAGVMDYEADGIYAAHGAPDRIFGKRDAGRQRYCRAVGDPAKGSPWSPFREGFAMAQSD